MQPKQSGFVLAITLVIISLLVLIINAVQQTALMELTLSRHYMQSIKQEHVVDDLN